MKAMASCVDDVDSKFRLHPIHEIEWRLMGAMKRKNSTNHGWHGKILIAAAFAFGLLTPAHCQSPAVELLLQQSPATAGTITPSMGLHHFAPYSKVAVSANPQPGYQFAYWLGDVGDPEAKSTTVYLDGPKVIVAVFEPIEDPSPVESEFGLAGGGGGGGGTFAAAGDYSRHGFGGSPGAPRTIVAETSPSAVMTAVPEPATVALLGLGGLAGVVLRRRR
jgi:hypothetical protein